MQRVARRVPKRRVLVAAASALIGCGSPEDSSSRSFELEFQARFGAEPVDCGADLSDLGSSGVAAKLLDFRLFVHDVELVRAGGQRVPFHLAVDGVWQRDGVALLDFEDGSGSCETGSSDTNVTLRGDAPPHDDYTGVAFTLGVPERLNHLDAATAPAPFNTPGLWWSWQGGYKYVKIDIATDDHPGGFFFHLGGTNCAGTPAEGFACQYANLGRIELSASGLGAIVIDGASLYRELDLSAPPHAGADLIPGCMASSGDPECPAMFAALGLAFEDDQREAPPQVAFELQ
jgi:uncharacterized repeat protein (TIGR04052 family)